MGGGTDLRCIHSSAKTYAKTKEMDPVGGGAHAGSTPADPPMVIYWRTSLVIAVTVILAPVADIKIVVVKRLAVGSRWHAVLATVLTAVS